MSELDFDKEIEICCEEMAREYKISEETAKHIISDFDLYDMAREYYEDAIKEAEQDYLDRQRREFEDNQDIYGYKKIGEI